MDFIAELDGRLVSCQALEGNALYSATLIYPSLSDVCFLRVDRSCAIDETNGQTKKHLAQRCTTEHVPVEAFFPMHIDL